MFAVIVGHGLSQQQMVHGTLQELPAPLQVEFFSREGKRLGDKVSLEQKIQ